MQHLPKIIIVLLMLVVVGVPFALRPAATDASIPGGEGVNATGGKLIIITPHNEQIRYELARGYNAHRIETGRPPVQFDWRTSGGTSDLRRQVLAQFTAKAALEREDEGIGIDLFFGGGDYEHEYQLKPGVTVKRDSDGDGTPEEVTISCSVPVRLDKALVAAAFPNVRVGEAKLYDPEGYWYGTAMASFGIVYNRDVLSMLDVPEPTSWSDMADPRLIGTVALADPGHSGSITTTYDAILRRMGWNEGWAMLRRAFANSRYFGNSATKVPTDVSAGEAAMGMCIDFYGRYQAGAMGKTEAGHMRVGYVDPYTIDPATGRRVSETAMNADPVSLMRGAPNRETAVDFMNWMLTKQAQRYWQFRAGTPRGPDRYELRRPPVREDMYTPQEKVHWTDPEIDLFETAQAYPDGTPRPRSTVTVMCHAMAMDVHDELRAAWQAIIDTRAADPADPRLAEMLALFDAMPEEATLTWPDDELAAHWQTIMATPAEGTGKHPRRDEVVALLNKVVNDTKAAIRKDENATRIAWTRFFRGNYRRILELASE